MPKYVMLTRLSHDAMRKPADLKSLEKSVAEQIRKVAPAVKWNTSLAILGACDYLDIFDAPNEEEAAKVSLVVRSFGHAYTELWTALEWERFKQLA